MSGTSCDALDMALCQWTPSTGEFEFLDVQEQPYPIHWRKVLRNLGQWDHPSVFEAERAWTDWVIDALRPWVDAWQSQHGPLHLIGFSGHTWYHEPSGRGTAALGDAQALHRAFGIPVVAEYREADVAAGGQGAPLVPLFDAHMFADRLACVNLGGIANITILPGGPTESVRAWDVCGANLLLNRQARRLGLDFDRAGALAKRGEVNSVVLQRMTAWPHLGAPPPKSLAAEDLEPLHALLDGIPKPEDALATAVGWMAMALTEAVKSAERPGRILVTGGGAWNEALLENWRSALPEGTELELPAERWIKGKEAAAFAWLALRTVGGEPTSLASVTGAEFDVCGGRLFGNFAGPIVLNHHERTA